MQIEKLKDVAEFIQEFSYILEETEITSLGANTNYLELDEWSSLAVLSVIAHFDEKYKISIPPNVIHENTTFVELYNSIKDL